MKKLQESPESSSPIVTRAVAAGLRGELMENYMFPAWQRSLLNLLGYFPQSVGRFAVSRFQTASGLPPDTLKDFDLDDLIRSRLDDYSRLHTQFPAVTLGAALGGASTYLSLAAGGPFLPQAFVITLRHGSRDGDAEEYLLRSLDEARRIASEDPRLVTIQHFDPIHDGWLTRFVNHLRFKLIDIPDLYAEFIKKHLQPGGAVIYLEGGAAWLRYRVGERSVFQVGGWGDISAEEYLETSDRLAAYARSAGLKHHDWRLTRYPLERGPESEWGSEPGFAQSLERYCQREGFRFVRIPLPHPNDFSRLAFASAQKILSKEGVEPSGVLVECFSQFDSNSARMSGLLPLWLIFNTKDSARYLKEMSIRFPKDKPLFFSGLSTFSITPDMAGWQDWIDALSREDFINIGTRQSHYPSDTRALVQWQKPLQDWALKNKKPVTATLSAEELLLLAEGLH
jgi:hypothetical protein